MKTNLNITNITLSMSLICGLMSSGAAANEGEHSHQLAKGFESEMVWDHLTYPSSIEFDNRGNIFVAEAGYAYGDESAVPRILRKDRYGNVSELENLGLSGPINDLLWHNDLLYISHRGKISTLDSAGEMVHIVDGLPSFGDHQNNQLTIGPDGRIYVGQGTATNSGVVGNDNLQMGWLKKYPDFHDVPPFDILLRSVSFQTINLLNSNSRSASTFAFHPFGSKVTANSVARGKLKANGTILSFNPDGSDLKMHAWGLRNPYGLIFGLDGRLFATENGNDVRGSRPIANDVEDLYIIKKGAWYGWPDYAAGIPITDARFKPKDGPQPQFLLARHPKVQCPLKTFAKHSAITKLDVAPHGSFGFAGDLFIAFFGHMTPLTGNAPKEHGGHRVLRFNPATGSTEKIFSMEPSEGGGHAGFRGESHENAEQQGGGRFIDVRFNPAGDALYVVDFGKMEVTPTGPKPHRMTGVVWKIVPKKSIKEGKQ